MKYLQILVCELWQKEARSYLKERIFTKSFYVFDTIKEWVW